VELKETTRCLVKFSEEHTLACKVVRLKEIRQSFI
jgi:hypothetical protein